MSQIYMTYLGINPMSHPSFTTLPIHQSSLNFYQTNKQQTPFYFKEDDGQQ